jgi:DNA-binding beta-propeller fold protein YncE
MGLAFDSQGNLYSANYYGDNIEKFTPAGGVSFFARGLNYPWGLAFDRAGNLFVANFWGNNIEKLTPTGASSIFASVSGQSSLRDLAFDSAGNLYATDYANDTIMKFDPNGVGSVFANVGGNPNGIAIQAVPEPSTFALLGAGLLTLLACSMERRRP